MKKTYIIPTIEVIEFATELLIATSPTPGIGTGTTPGGGVDAEEEGLSNKRQPMNNSWGSQNWNKDGE